MPLQNWSGTTDFTALKADNRIDAGTINSTGILSGVNFKRGTVTFDIVRGTAIASSSGSKAIAHGLTSVAMAVSEKLSTTAALMANALYMSNKTVGGTTTFYTWKATSAATTTPIAATVAATFNYLILGTA